MSLDDVFLGYSTLAQLTPEQRNSALADLGSMRPPLMIINRYTPLGSWQTQDHVVALSNRSAT